MNRDPQGVARVILRAAIPVALAAAALWLWGRRGTAKRARRDAETANIAFPSPDDFEGSFLPRQQDALNGAQSTFRGAVVVTMLPRTLVEKRLPAGFRLARSKTGAAYHPVIHLVGHQEHPSYLFQGQPTEIPGQAYHEMILLIPFVQDRSGLYWHNYAAWMYLDNLWAIWIGDLLYGYHKEQAQLDELGGEPDPVKTLVWPASSDDYYFIHTWRIRRHPDPDGPPEPWRVVADAATALPRFADIQKIFEMPVLGFTTSPLGGPPGRIVCSFFEWNYDDAQVAPAIASCRHGRTFGRPPGTAGPGWTDWEQLGSLRNAPDGAYVLRGLRWRLSTDLRPCRFSGP
ncbi:MAG: hypothetical protein JWO70_2084 [Betaproteobacteria bacterium]|jgi:hypothetical protein|nr:hypothetical protein [Betaproteobacteria bacterium]